MIEKIRKDHTMEIDYKAPNFTLSFDDMGIDSPYGMQFQFRVRKTFKARMKYWLFCKFFPFKITRWDIKG